MEQGLITNESSQESKVITAVQAAIEQEMGVLAQMLPQLDEAAQQFAPAAPPPDTTMAIAQMNAQLQDKVLQQRQAADQAKSQVDQARIQLEQAKMQISMQSQQQTDQIRMELDQAKFQLEQAKMQFEVQKQAMMHSLRQEDRLSEDQRTAADLQTRLAMNMADNETAKELAAAEVASGEKFAVSTGTGINPNPGS
jgi:chromosome segregation ATPase